MVGGGGRCGGARGGGIAVNHRLYTFISVFPSKREGYDKMMFYCGRRRGATRRRLESPVSACAGFIYTGWRRRVFFLSFLKPARRLHAAEQGIKQCLLICSMGC